MSVTGERGRNDKQLSSSLLNAGIVTQAVLEDPSSLINQRASSGKQKGAMVYVQLPSGLLTTAVAQGPASTDAWEYVSSDMIPQQVIVPTRKKMQVEYHGVSLVIPTTENNLISLLGTLGTPSVGTLSSFFNSTSNKLNAYNDNASLFFKLNLTGSWTSSSSNRAITLDFSGTVGNKLTANRVLTTNPDTIQFFTYFSIDKNGNIATNGTSPVIQAIGSTFTVTDILLVAEQLTTETAITPV